jgi:hypothetical protein
MNIFEPNNMIYQSNHIYKIIVKNLYLGLFFNTYNLIDHIYKSFIDDLYLGLFLSMLFCIAYSPITYIYANIIEYLHLSILILISLVLIMNSSLIFCKNRSPNEVCNLTRLRV